MFDQSFAGMLCTVDEGHCVDVVFSDLPKAFESGKVPNQRLLEKLKKHGIIGTSLHTTGDGLSNSKQRVCIKGMWSSWEKYEIESHSGQYRCPCYS